MVDILRGGGKKGEREERRHLPSELIRSIIETKNSVL
jgi:hypothetical protein